MARLTHGEKAAIRLLNNPKLSERRRWMVLDSLFHRSGGSRMIHIEYLADRYRRMKGIQ